MSTTVLSTVQPFVKGPSGDDTFSVDFTAVIGTRTISSATASVSPTGLTVDTVQANVAAYTDEDTGATVDASHAVQFDASGGTADVDYTVTLTATLSDAAVKQGVCVVQVRAE